MIKANQQGQRLKQAQPGIAPKSGVVYEACVEAGVNGLNVATEKDRWSQDAAAKAKDLIYHVSARRT